MATFALSEFFGGGCMILIIMWRIVMDTLPDQGIKLLCQLLCLVLSSNCLTPAAPTFYCLIKTGVDLYKHQQCTYAIPDSTDVEKTSCHHHCIIKSLWKRVTHGVAGECILARNDMSLHGMQAYAASAASNWLLAAPASSHSPRYSFTPSRN